MPHAHFALSPMPTEGSLPHTPTTDAPNPFSRPSSPVGQVVEKKLHMGFVGLGNMGQKMALNLAKHLHETQQPPLKVWNRSQDRVEAFQKLAENTPTEVVQSLKEIGETCEVVFTSLGSEAVEAVYTELFAAQEGRQPSPLKKTTYIDTSTIYPTTAGRIERLASKLPGRHFLSCPAFGEPDVAEKADLVFAISGDYRSRKFAAHLLIPALGRKVMDLGSNPERAASFKLVGNTMILGVLELLAESMTLADQSGVGKENLYKLIQEIYPADSFVNYAKKLLKNDFGGEQGFTLDGGIQDASHIRHLGEEHNVPLPMIDLAHQHLVSARAAGGSDLDWSSLVGGVRIASGLPAFKDKKSRLERYE